jgi:protein arginine kinase activator
MLCQLCKQREASVHFTQIVNQQKVEMFVCEQCVGENSKLKINLNKLLSGFMGMDNHSGIANAPVQPVKCNGCGMSIKEFNKTGKFGCSKCYESFTDSIQTMLKQIHGNVKHHGKIPARISETIKQARELQDLKSKLQKCVLEENYEQAAVIRDKIKAIEKTAEKKRTITKAKAKSDAEAVITETEIGTGAKAIDETGTKSESEMKAETKDESEAKAETETKAATKAKAIDEVGTKSEFEMKAEIKDESEAKAETETKAATKAKAIDETGTKSESEMKAETKDESEAKAETETKRGE